MINETKRVDWLEEQRIKTNREIAILKDRIDRLEANVYGPVLDPDHEEELAGLAAGWDPK